MNIKLALEVNDPITYLVQIAFAAAFLTVILVLALRALLPHFIRRRLGLRLVAHLFATLVAPLRGAFRLFTLNPTREHALPSHHLVLQNFPLTPLEFFAIVEGVIGQRQVPGLYLSSIARREKGLFSPRRWYLHLSYQTSLCIIGAMPVGTTFVISLRVGEVASWAQLLLREYPRLHRAIDWFLRPPTLYHADINTAFQQLARQALLDSVDQITNVRGLRALNEAERRQLIQRAV